ncbi:hypothetical protein [Chitinophaga cymbidii]|uniref:TraB family protein n=1 Tax=Chitinophaga cymbidii TaxID=1096750 RepID=A0A512RFN0_9BACT|nr:hypothetical protein [Chitinophaga cymbidii]GEP94510.1 hypothetical protein CCY01nite_07700 [Chitinophaga cymbidii]
MHNITLIGTRHAECGKCNSDELYQIIGNIQPEVIFEEIPPSFFDAYYINKTRNNLETDAINKYSETHKVKQIPVDCDNVPSESFFQDHGYMLKRIEGLIDINGFNYRSLVDSNWAYVQKYGFKYLNSVCCINMNDEIYNTIEKSLQILNNGKLFQTHQLMSEINEKRETVMLQNIYKYSEGHSYDKAIFILGAGHRKSIMQKIQKYQRSEELKLNWTFYM